MRLALDAMGGDHGPAPNVAGALLALAASPDLTVVLVGDRAQLDPILAAGPSSDRLEVVHATQTVEMKEKPVEALRKKPDASVFRCWHLMAEGKVDGLVSAGNTGAIVAGGVRLRKFLKCGRPPRLAPVLPTAEEGRVVFHVRAGIYPKPRRPPPYSV